MIPFLLGIFAVGVGLSLCALLMRDEVRSTGSRMRYRTTKAVFGWAVGLTIVGLLLIALGLYQ